MERTNENTVSKAILVTLNRGEEIIVTLEVPKDCDETEYINNWLDWVIPSAKEWR